jgi:hypothetical protein
MHYFNTEVTESTEKTANEMNPGVIESDVSGLEAGSKAAASGLGMMR